MKRARDMVTRFWEKVDKRGESDCWLWLSADDKRYGRFWVNEQSRSEYAHRVSYILTYGPIPSDLYVCHRCDNTKCVNPGHLFLGTALDNSHDMLFKGRGARQVGTTNPAAKLTDVDVVAIRAMYATGKISQESIALQFGVSRKSVAAIINGKTWAHVA